jgi:hypothetical protein
MINLLRAFLRPVGKYLKLAIKISGVSDRINPSSDEAVTRANRYLIDRVKAKPATLWQLITFP